MSDILNNYFGIHQDALRLRAMRAQVITENLVNADTPKYKARDIDFQQVLSAAQQQMSDADTLVTTQANHIKPGSFEMATQELAYRNPYQSSLDGNTVDAEVEKTEFARNALEYQVSLKFLDGKIRTLLMALRGE